MKIVSPAAILFIAAISALPATSFAAEAAKAMTGHPGLSNPAPAVVHPAKPMPQPKQESVPKAPREGAYWAPGDYYYDGGDWGWADGYWLDAPIEDAMWVPGHWADHWWGNSWVPGHWI